MRIAVVKETSDAEARVAATPDTIKKLKKREIEIAVESGAGIGASITDTAFEEAGADIIADRKALLGSADLVLAVRPLSEDDAKATKQGALLLAVLDPFNNKSLLEAYGKAGLTAFAMEFMPRITRAQSMDVLSSQSNLAGYKAVLDACEHFGRAMPMMMTAAGTIAPARVFIMGVGVAGLQAIATARRLGAVVTATDVRLATKEQVESLGAKFVMVDDDEAKDAETAGGYAKEMSDDYKAKQAALVAEHIKKQDIVITTALIPGRPAPRLITAEMVQSMKPGSVLVDLAAEQGGNVEGSKPGEVVETGGVKIVANRNVPSRLATDASSLYAKNLLNLLELILDKEKPELAIDWDDEIVQGILVVKDGGIANDRLTDAA